MTDEALDALLLSMLSWQSGSKPEIVRIVPDQITGRRFTVLAEFARSPLPDVLGSSLAVMDVPAQALRRQGSHLYGLVITGAVLATVNQEFRLVRVAVVLLSTLATYWAAETFVHWTTARTLLQRDLTHAERRAVILDGWPLVAASGIPLLLLAIEALLQVETGTALHVALGVNLVLLLGVGYQMGKAGGLKGTTLVLSAALTGALGLVMILLKSTLH